MNFEEFCAAAISPYQLEALDRWEEIAGTSFQHFEQEGNRVISVEELAQVCKITVIWQGIYLGCQLRFVKMIFVHPELRTYEGIIFFGSPML